MFSYRGSKLYCNTGYKLGKVPILNRSVLPLPPQKFRSPSQEESPLQAQHQPEELGHKE